MEIILEVVVHAQVPTISLVLIGTFPTSTIKMTFSISVIQPHM